jgi:hypothetical protein
VPVKAARVRQAWHAGDQRKLAEPQQRVRRRVAFEPRSDLIRGGGPHQRVVKRRPVAFENRALAAAVSDLELRSRRHGAAGVRRQRELARQLPTELERESLTQARRAVALEHDITTSLQLQAVQRSLKREPPSVD